MHMWQAVRDALAALHGEPRRAQLGEPKHEAGTAAAIANSLHTHTQQTVLDSLVPPCNLDSPHILEDDAAMRQ